MIRAAAIGSMVLAALLVLEGCASGNRPPRAKDSGYAGPPISVEESGSQHIVVLTAPTAGWSFSLDEVRDRMGGKDVFVTVRRPNPAYLHAQAEVVQNLGTEVASNVPLEVYARVLDHDTKNGSLSYYHAAESP